MIVKYINLGNNLVYVTIERKGVMVLYINIKNVLGKGRMF